MARGHCYPGCFPAWISRWTVAAPESSEREMSAARFKQNGADCEPNAHTMCTPCAHRVHTVCTPGACCLTTCACLSVVGAAGARTRWPCRQKCSPGDSLPVHPEAGRSKAFAGELQAMEVERCECAHDGRVGLCRGQWFSVEKWPREYPKRPKLSKRWRLRCASCLLSWGGARAESRRFSRVSRLPQKML